MKHASQFLVLILALTGSKLTAQLEFPIPAEHSPLSAAEGCVTKELPSSYETWVQSLQADAASESAAGKSQSVFNIPVIVHVIHDNEQLNSPTSLIGHNLNSVQIYDQINILNRDFNARNPDTILIPAIFKPLLANLQINFCLAAVNPTGGVLAEPGIDRVDRTTMGWKAPPYAGSFLSDTIIPSSIWDPTRYFNIWVMQMTNNISGFSSFPSPGTSGLSGLPPNAVGSATNDGIVIQSKYFGSKGAVAGNFVKGRLAVHETGHWLGLRHIWGDFTCGNDHCADTPPAQAANTGCPSAPWKTGSCPGNTTGEMFMNYMDYTAENCRHMFTKDQKNRTQLILTHSPMRAALLTSTVCNGPAVVNDIGILYVSSPTYSQVIDCKNFVSPAVVIHNFGTTIITSATYSYNVDGASTQTLAWTGTLNPGASATVSIPMIQNLGNGTHQFNVGVYAPNGLPDPASSNNTNNQHFSVINSYAISVAGPTAVCAGSSATLTAAGGAQSYTWFPGTFTGAVHVITPTAPTVYTIATGQGTCVNSATVSVNTSSAVPAAPVITTTNYPCDEPCAGMVHAQSGSGANVTYSVPGTTCTTQPCGNLCPGLYALHTSNSFGCKTVNFFSIACFIRPGMPETDQGTLLLFPNPVHDVLSLESRSAFSYRLCDHIGRRLESSDETFTSHRIDMRIYPAGLYLLEIREGGMVRYRKVMKE